MSDAKRNPVLTSLRAYNADVARFATQPATTATLPPTPAPQLRPAAPATPQTMPEAGFGDMPLTDSIFGDADRLQINHMVGQIYAPRSGFVLASDHELVAHAPQMAWILWEDGQVADRKWKQPGQPLPARQTLQPPPPPPPAQDVWKKAVYWRLADPANGAEYVFCGTASAIGPLSSFDRAVKLKRDRHGDVWPVVVISLQGVQKPGQNKYYVLVIGTRRYVFEDGSSLVEESA